MTRETAAAPGRDSWGHSGADRSRQRQHNGATGWCAMTWSKYGVEFWDDLANAGLSDAAARTHGEAIGWLYRIERDDLRIPKRLVPRFASSPEHATGIKELITAGFWADEGDAYVVTHHAEVVRQSIAAQVIHRETERERQRRKRRTRAESVTPNVGTNVGETQTDRQTNKQALDGGTNQQAREDGQPADSSPPPEPSCVWPEVAPHLRSKGSTP